MTHRIVLDTSAVVAYWLEEPGADVVEAQLLNKGCVMHEINVSELCVTMPRKRPDRFTRQNTRTRLEALGVTSRADFDREWAETIADIRHATSALSIGDGFAVTLAGTLGVPLLVAEKAFLNAAGFATVEHIRL